MKNKQTEKPSQPRGAQRDMTTKHDVIPWMRSRNRTRTLGETKGI